MENTSVFKDLNSDVIHEILYKFVSVDPNGPFKLLNICKAWNTLVGNSPQLWTWIHINNSIISWEKRLFISLRKSKELPLHVILGLPLIGADAITESLDASHSMFSESFCLPRWCTLEVDMSDEIDTEGAQSFVMRLLGDSPLLSLRSLRWFRKGIEITKPPERLTSHYHLFQECIVKERSSLNCLYLNRKKFPFLTCLDLTFISNNQFYTDLSLRDFLSSLRLLPRLRNIKLKSTLIDWNVDLSTSKTALSTLEALTLDIYRPESTVDPGMKRSKSQTSFQVINSDPLETLFTHIYAPALRSITLFGIAGDIYRSLYQLNQFPCLKQLSLVVRWWEPSLENWRDQTLGNLRPVSSLEGLSLQLEADNAYPNFQLDRAKEFLEALFMVTPNVTTLFTLLHSAAMLNLLQRLLPRLKQLLHIEWKRGYSVKGWRKDNHIVDGTQPQLTVLSQVHKIVINSYSDFDWFPFLCPAARKIVANGWDYTKLSNSTFTIPNANHLQEIDLGLFDIRAGFNEYIQSPVKFTQLNSLRCNLSVLVHFPIESAHNLRHLALLPYSEEEDTIDELPQDVVSILMKARRIERLELFAPRVIYEGEVQTMVDVYLAALYGQLRKRERSLLKVNGRGIGITGSSFNLRILETQCYPDWFVLCDVMKLLRSTHFPAPLQALYVPGTPHPSIKQAIVSAFRGEFRDQNPNLKPGMGCQYCIDSGWECVNTGREDEFDMCGRHSTTSLVALSGYTL